MTITFTAMRQIQFYLTERFKDKLAPRFTSEGQIVSYSIRAYRPSSPYLSIIRQNWEGFEVIKIYPKEGDNYFILLGKATKAMNEILSLPVD